MMNHCLNTFGHLPILIKLILKILNLTIFLISYYLPKTCFENGKWTWINSLIGTYSIQVILSGSTFTRASLFI